MGAHTWYEVCVTKELCPVAGLLEEIRETENLACSRETNDPTGANERLAILRDRLTKLKSGGDPAPDDSSVGGTLDSAKAHIARFRELYPNAAFIFVRLHYHKHGRPAFKLLHSLTVDHGSTATERRERANKVSA
jgi:hypothetical protein